HRPHYWPRPLTYNPNRSAEDLSHSLADHVFKDGPRNCVGMRLALLTIKLALCNILPRMNIMVSRKCVWKCKHIFHHSQDLIIRIRANYEFFSGTIFPCRSR
ncbi:cytochrome P450 3A6-like, partial [Tropilaelaps mercedesae]